MPENYQNFIGAKPAMPWAVDPGNPRTYPARRAIAVNEEVLRADRQQRELEATMVATGQAGALVIAKLQAVRVAVRGFCTVTFWAEGPITVLPSADVVALFELPKTVDSGPRITYVRWDVLARVCGSACWNVVSDLDPARVISRRWPTDDHLEVLHALSLPEPAFGAPTSD